MTRLRAILALALAAAPLTLAACGHPPPSIVVRAQPGDRAGGLTATGSATIGVSPDCADLTLTITREATDARGAIAQVRERQAALVATLARLGLPSADVTLAHLGVDPVYDYVDGKSVLRGYQASTVITATTRQFDQIAPLMEAAADAGATAMSSRFRRSDLEALKQDVRAQAIAAAQAKAQATAAALGVQLGAVTAVAEANPSYLFANVYFPSAGGGGDGLGGDLQPLTIDVVVTYDLG